MLLISKLLHAVVFSADRMLIIFILNKFYAKCPNIWHLITPGFPPIRENFEKFFLSGKNSRF